MRVALILALLAAPFFASPSTLHANDTAAIATADSDSMSAARRTVVAARLYAAVRMYFAHWYDVPDLDFDEAFAAYVEEATAAPDRRAFTLASLALLTQLGNSHTGFRDGTLFDDAGRLHGFSVRHIGEEWVVVKSAREGVRPGDVISSIDGQPIESFYSGAARYISASTERHRRWRLFDRWYRFLFPLRYTLTMADGREVVIDRSGKAERDELATEGRWLQDGRVAYIQVPSWNGSQFQERALELLEEYAGAAALVVDVRDNGGGSTPVSFISALMERPWRWWAESTPMHLALFSYYAARERSGFSDFARPQMSWPASTQDGDSTFTGRLMILVNEGCHSACEDFVMPFKDNGRATLVGEATAGSTGQPFYADIGDRMGFAVGAKREYFPDGSQFEGVGVMPDIRVLPTRTQLQAGRDAVLERALEEIASEAR
jgi:carboxyl-terminal processing protease